jgi:hypothetical protein
VTSAPTRLSTPPQLGQAQAAAWITSSRGRWSGSGRRAGLTYSASASMAAASSGTAARRSAWSAGQSLCSHGRHLPREDGFDSEPAERGAGDEVALQIEGVVDRSVDREKALSRRRRFETLHLPLASSHRLVGVLRPVVLANALLMASAKPEMAARSPVGPKSIGDEHARRIALLPEELAHQPKGGCLVALGLDEQVEDLTFAVDGSPKVHAPAAD